jgi:molybdopterin/thiamine biosynthesis adenylyltransferase
MPAFVTVLQDQLDQLRKGLRSQRLRVVEAVAFAVEGEDVYHLFTSRPPYRPTGVPVPGFFVMREAGRLPDNLEAVLRERGAGGASPVVVVDASPSGGSEAFLGPAMNAPCVLHVVSPRSDASARMRGLLESDALALRRVLIAGLGSFGSTAAVELAKAGVGGFDLFDMDRLEPGNVMRHQCGVADIGRLKTRAVRDAILGHNPAAEVATHDCDINDSLPLLRECASRCDLVICLCDQGRSRFNCNAVAVAAGRPALFARAITRAAGGDVFRLRPGGPCLACLFSQGVQQGADEVGSQRQADWQTPDYAPPRSSADLVQPGLAADIAPIVQMLVKLAIVELAPRGSPQWDSLREDLSAPFYIWANRRDLIYKDWQPMRTFYNRNSIMRWYGVDVAREPGCMTCSLSA